MDPCDFIGMQREDYRTSMLREFEREFGRGPGARSVDAYDWEAGEHGELVVLPAWPARLFRTPAWFGGWLLSGWSPGSAVFLLPDGVVSSSGAVLDAGGDPLSMHGEVHVGFLSRRLPGCEADWRWGPGTSMLNLGELSDIAGGRDCLVARCGLGLPRESRLDEVLA